ncbi:protein TolR [candidate division KSB3 bacterium]|uniref:Protein TolR n=1 Tax=candidate division KSB3 bacterium TaxID=2044937 RepID=A0A2G6EDK1_9BACT|nr:MAG: protein TolR [candidate division KSB3 bacterium]PIE31066.1 MAG: protein TolR [candidate division KSB3 bacterium]
MAASRFFRSKKSFGTLSDVNMIPLVDIVFTLLIVFMVLAPMIHKGIEVQVPESAAGETVVDQERHIVSLNQEGRIWFDDQEMSLEELRARLQSVSSEDTLYVQADKYVPYGEVIAVISEIKGHGIGNVGLVTSPRPSQQNARDNRTGRSE